MGLKKIPESGVSLIKIGRVVTVTENLSSLLIVTVRHDSLCGAVRGGGVVESVECQRGENTPSLLTKNEIMV